MSRISVAPAAMATVIFFASTCWAATIDFDSIALGTQYGNPAGHAPGDVVLSQWDVDMSVEVFTSGVFSGFNFAEVAGVPGPPVSFFPPALNSTQTLTLNNIDVRFDFTGVGFDIGRVEFEYADLGGEENFDLNALGRQEVSALSGLGPFAGFNVTVSQNPIAGGVAGVVEIEALPGHRIETLLVGGQEFAIDNLTKMQASFLGDTDGDGDVDIDDLNNVRNGFGMTGMPILGDTDGDNDVDITDLNNVRNNFGVAVPEPATVALLAAGFAMCWTTFRGRRVGNSRGRQPLGIVRKVRVCSWRRFG